MVQHMWQAENEADALIPPRRKVAIAKKLHHMPRKRARVRSITPLDQLDDSIEPNYLQGGAKPW